MPGASEAMEKAVQLVQTCGIFSEARNAVEAAQVKLWLEQGDGPALDRWLGSLENPFDLREPFRYENERKHITRARAWIARRKPDEAIELLSHLEETAESCGRIGRLIEIILLKALALQASGKIAQAVNTLRKSLALARPEGYIRIYLDEGKPLIQLLKKAQGEMEPSLKEYIDRILEAGAQSQN